MMKLDLERAGLAYCNDDGLYADFHANRHTFISNLARAGVSPKMAQSIARHSDVNLTLNVYSHVGIGEQATAIQSLPGPPIDEPEEPIALPEEITIDADQRERIIFQFLRDAPYLPNADRLGLARRLEGGYLRSAFV
jgi:hypothetical protein